MDHGESLRDRLVHFRVRDVYLPDARDLALLLHGDDILQGRVVDVSDSGASEAAYVVVSVDGVEGPIVVSTAGILGAL